MLDQYFGIKELSEVVLKAHDPMRFGSRYLEAGEPVLYFEKVNMAVLNERQSTIMARGGWSNMPRVIWEDRSEVQFSLTEGVMSSISMGILLSASITEAKQSKESLLIPKREGPFELEDGCIYITHQPVLYPAKKVFIYQYERGVAQKKVYGQLDPENNRYNSFLDETEICIKVFEDKERTKQADATKEYIVDYYYEYNEEALLYTIQKERFNGLFTLEGKFYSKDENDGLNYTNLIYMPKVRVVSDINLRLGERADPAVSTFNIIGLPETVGNGKNNLIVEITRLGTDIDGNI
jgi:hypothetical protein